jgi:hypothetical protein
MIIKTKLYNSEVELVFDSFRHSYHVNDSLNGKFQEKVPSVTTALSILNKPALVNWAANMAADSIKESLKPGVPYDELEIQAIIEAGRKAHYQRKTDAGLTGTFVHKWVEDYIKGNNPGMPINQNLKDAINRFLEWKEKHQVEFLLSEQQIYSRKYNYTGTLDFICKVDDKMYIGDLKTSTGIYPEYLVQTAAYRQARVEEFPDEVYAGQLIVRIGKEDGAFEFAKVTDEMWYKKMFVGFIGALKTYETMELLKEFKAERE